MTDPTLFDNERRHLMGVAYRMLGSHAEAEDVVQEAYLRFHDADIASVENVQAWLTTVVTRLAIDRLRRLQIERASYPGEWLPEPWADEPAVPSAEDCASMNADLSFGFLLMLERLNPTERATFLLHDVLDHDYRDIAAMVQKSEANVRQILHRARERLRDTKRESTLSPDTRARLLSKLSAAIKNRDNAALVALLEQHAQFHGDGGGKVPAATKPLHGGELVARFMLGVTEAYTADMSVDLVSVNAMPALAWKLDGKLVSIMVIEASGDRIERVYNVANPDKLRHIAAQLGLVRYFAELDSSRSVAL